MLSMLRDGRTKAQQDQAMYQVRRKRQFHRRLSTFHDVRENGAALAIGGKPSGDCDQGLCPAEVC